MRAAFPRPRAKTDARGRDEVSAEAPDAAARVDERQSPDSGRLEFKRQAVRVLPLRGADDAENPRQSAPVGRRERDAARAGRERGAERARDRKGDRGAHGDGGQGGTRGRARGQDRSHDQRRVIARAARCTLANYYDGTIR